MNPQALLLEGALLLARYLWHKAHGADTKPDEEQIKAAARTAAKAAAQAAALEVERLAAVAGMQAATAELDKAAADLLYELGRVETDPSPDVPHILEGTSIEQMPPGSKLDASGNWETPEDVPLSPVLDADDVPTEPGKP
jgi:hypothetical protein